MAQNDFLQFDETKENTLTQEAYSTDVQRVGGVSSGLARSALFNKVMRQASTFVAGFGNFIAEKNIDILEDLGSVKTALTNLFKAKNIGVSTETQSLLGSDNVDDVIKALGNKINNSGINAFAKPVLIKYASVNTNQFYTKLANWDEMYGYDFIVIYYNINIYYKNLYNGVNSLRVHFVSTNTQQPSSGLEDITFTLNGSGAEETKNFYGSANYGVASVKHSYYPSGGYDFTQRNLPAGTTGSKALILNSNGVGGSISSSPDSFGLFLYTGLDKAGDSYARFNISGDIHVFGYKFNHD